MILISATILWLCPSWTSPDCSSKEAMKNEWYRNTCNHCGSYRIHLYAVLLVVASKVFFVPVDERVDGVREASAGSKLRRMRIRRL